MSKKTAYQLRVKRELRKVRDGKVPSAWLARRCWKDEEPKTLALRREVFPNLCGPEPLTFSFVNLNNLAKIYFNPRIVEQFKKQCVFLKHIEDEAEQ